MEARRARAFVGDKTQAGAEGTFVRTMDLKTSKIGSISETRALPVRVGTGAERTTKLLAQLLAVSVRRVPAVFHFGDIY